MSKLSPIRARILIKILEKLGFEKIRQEGSHTRFVHIDGLLKKILKDVDITRSEFEKLK